MSSHLSLKIAGQYAVLPEDFSIDVEDVNPLFNDYESFTFDAALPIHTNRHILKDVDNIRSDKRMVDMENQSIELIVDGVPFRSGRLQVREDEELSDTVTFSMVSNSSTLNDLVADLNCRDVELKDKIQIGEKIGDLTVEMDYDWNLYILHGEWDLNDLKVLTYKGGRKHYNMKCDLQALGFSTTHSYDDSINTQKESFINVTESYPNKYYCNTRVCYTHYKKEEDGTSGKTVSDTDRLDPYYVLEADRQQSGICFYLLYFLDCLFNQLGFMYNNDPLVHVGDLARLAFFTTRCQYKEERKYPERGIPGMDKDIQYDFLSKEDINNWLSSKETKGFLSMEQTDTKELDDITIGDEYYKTGKFKYINGKRRTILQIQYKAVDMQVLWKANIMNMYATADNFPDMSVSSVIDSLWGSFGIRFLVDYEKKIVKPVLIRDVYRNQDKPMRLYVRIVRVCKLSEKITGFRMKYSRESDTYEQNQNIKNEAKDYDTEYDYTDYRNVNSSLTYGEIVKRCSSSDKTCYIDKETGNAYRIKVNADATMQSELKPTFFEVAAYKGVEIGDCSKQNEDFVFIAESEFEPLTMNDLNGKFAVNSGNDGSTTVIDESTGESYTINGSNTSVRKMLPAAFVDEEMWNESCKIIISNSFGDEQMGTVLNEEISTSESYDPSSTEDGNSPLQHHDWGNAICIMRGGGSDAEIQIYDYDYDGCGNSKWRTVAGEYAMSSDSIDNWGNKYDYNGTQPGIGGDERFSLKIRAFKEINGEILCQDDERDESGRVVNKIRTRGLYDTFFSEHAHFLLNRKKMLIEFYCSVTDILNIQWDKRYQIDDLVFWWNKLNYTVDMTNGLSKVSAEIFVL